MYSAALSSPLVPTPRPSHSSEARKVTSRFMRASLASSPRSGLARVAAHRSKTVVARILLQRAGMDVPRQGASQDWDGLQPPSAVGNCVYDLRQQALPLAAPAAANREPVNPPQESAEPAAAPREKPDRLHCE